jgi:hypothetical protein
MQAAVRVEAPAPVEMSPAALLVALAHLALDEIGAVMMLRLYRDAAGELPADEASLAALSRLGAAWFKRPAGSDESRGARVLAALERIGVRPEAQQHRPGVAAAAPGRAGLSEAEMEQRRAAVKSRWSVVRGSGQMALPMTSAEPPGPVAVAAPPAVAARAAPAPPTPRPDRDEIPDAMAVDYVRGWLYQYAGSRKVPDEHTCRNVLAAARGASMWDLYAAINDLFMRGIRVGHSWGWFVACVRNHFGGASPAAAVV